MNRQPKSVPSMGIISILLYKPSVFYQGCIFCFSFLNTLTQCMRLWIVISLNWCAILFPCQSMHHALFGHAPHIQSSAKIGTALHWFTKYCQWRDLVSHNIHQGWYDLPGCGRWLKLSLRGSRAPCQENTLNAACSETSWTLLTPATKHLSDILQV